MLEINTIVRRYHVWIALLFVCTILASAAIVQERDGYGQKIQKMDELKRCASECAISSHDTSNYIGWADFLISHKFNFFIFYTSGSTNNVFVKTVEQNTSVFNTSSSPFFFTIPIVSIAILKLTMNDQWVIGYQIFNLIAIFIALFLYIKIAFYLGIRKWLISASLLIFLISIDFLTWPRYVLTDTLFVPIGMFAIYAVTTKTINHYPSCILIITSLFLVLISRPSSLPFVAVLLFFSFLPSLSQMILIKKTLMVRLGIFTLLSSVAYSIIMMAIFSDILQDLSVVKDLSSLGAYFWSQFGFFVKAGGVIHERPETYIAFEATHLGLVKIFLYRMVGFFTPFAKDFSLVHNTLNGLSLLGCYVIVLVMFRYSFNDFEQNNTRARAIALLSTLIIAVAVFQSALFLDYSWRYRYPVIAPLILLTTLVFDNFLNLKRDKN